VFELVSPPTELRHVQELRLEAPRSASRRGITVHRRKMGKDSTHTMDRDELRDLRKLRRETNSP